MPDAGFNSIHNTHAAYKIKLTLELDGKVVPVVDATIEFVLNQIPIAKVVIPSGATFNNKSAGAVPGPEILTPQDLQGKKTAKLRLNGKGKPHASGSKATPYPGTYDGVIFDGYVLSTTADFSTTGVATTVVLAHWMYDLDSASFSCGDFDKTAPDDWFAVEGYGLTEKSNVVAVKTGEKDLVPNTAYLSKDWWDDIIRPAAIYKAGLPLRHFLNNTAPSNNEAAIAAMQRLTSKGKLKLNGTASSALSSCGEVQNSINTMIGYSIFTGQGGSTAFEKFVSLLSGFGVVLAPRVDEVLVMAYNPLAAVDIEIPDSECDFGSSSANAAQLPVGAIMYGGGLPTQLAALDKSKVESSFVGSYTAEALVGSVDAGPFTVFPTPDYLNTIKAAQVPSGQFNSKVGIVPVSNSTQGKTTTTQTLLPKEFANEVAKSYYYSKVFSTKTQDVICGFRLDVAPGDCVKIFQTPNAVAGSNVSGLAKNWSKRGIVESVTHTLSASSNRINTSYRLRHVMEKQDMDLFKVSDKGQEAALFFNKPPNSASPLKVV